MAVDEQTVVVLETRGVTPASGPRAVHGPFRASLADTGLDRLREGQPSTGGARPLAGGRAFLCPAAVVCSSSRFCASRRRGVLGTGPRRAGVAPQRAFFLGAAQARNGSKSPLASVALVTPQDHSAGVRYAQHDPTCGG